MSSFCDLFHYHAIDFDSLRVFFKNKMNKYVYIGFRYSISQAFTSDHLQALTGINMLCNKQNMNKVMLEVMGSMCLLL